MRTQRRSGIGPRVVWAGLLGALVVGASPAVGRADPALKESICRVGTIQINKGPITWQVQGVTTLTGLPADTKGTSGVVTFTFERKRPGTDAWVKVCEVIQTVTFDGGTVPVDTGNVPFTPAAEAGEQFRVKVAAEYRLGGAKGEKKAVPGGESTPITAAQVR
jgi:hypothetical protein